MKLCKISLVIIGLFFSCTFAGYTPTSQDVTAITQLKNQFDGISSGDMAIKWDFYIQLKNLKEQFSGYEKLSYYLDTLSSYLMTQVNTEKIKAKASSKQFKQEFLNQYSGDIIYIPTSDSCTGRYHTIDSISYANNFPTALTIATWYRETNCGYYLPSNGNGPFQIRGKNYGTWAITEGKFLTAIQDFIDFSKTKRAQHQSKLSINLTYTGFDMTGLVYHGALYNGWTIWWDIILPNIPQYLYDNYTQAYSGATRYWLIPKFLKVLDRELKNTY